MKPHQKQIAAIRLAAQQLTAPCFDTPEELVAWMGAIQAQERNMVRWAVGTRLKTPSLKSVEGALDKGAILRTHVMRPTWHLVAAPDIRWMLALSAPRLRTVFLSYGRYLGIDKSHYLKANPLIEKALAGGRSLTKEQLAEEVTHAGMKTTPHQMGCMISGAEIEGIVCSGPDRGGKHTYTLLEERVPPAKALHKEEALALMARNYFRSHSPATMDDFSWWSGLSLTEARQAAGLIADELSTERFGDTDYIIHTSCPGAAAPPKGFHLLPSFDEYLISYKDRTAVLDPKHAPKAYTMNGIFHPVVVHNGKITGNWRKTACKGGPSIEATFFEPAFQPKEAMLDRAKERYKSFLK